MGNLIRVFFASVLVMCASYLSAQTITITSPNGGESWNGCTARTITWSFSGIASPFFDIDYSADNGSNWAAVASNYNSPGGTFSWTLPNITSSNFLIRVRLSSNPLVQDVSDAVFSVTGPLILTSPNGGQSWVAGTTQTITWAPNGTSNNYRLEYSTNNGASWITIINPLATTGNTYNWTIPNTPSNVALVRIADNGDPTCKVDVSDNTFFLLSSVTVTAPNGGQNWQATVGNQGTSANMDNVSVTANTGNFYDAGGSGSNYTTTSTLTKTFTPDVGTNKLQFVFTSFSLGSGHQLTIHNGPTTGSPVIGNYTGTSNPGTVTSTHATGALTFVFTAPSGAVSTGWESYFRSVGTATQNINWSIVGTSGRYNLDYSTNNGVSWIRIVSNYPTATGTFPWNVPNTPSTISLVRVSDATNGAIVDQSDAVFTIGPAAPLLIAPNGGETWYAGTVQNITWVSSFFTGANVKLEYSTDNGTTWTTIVSSTPNATGSFPWTIPLNPSTTALVRISDAGAPAFNDVSNAVFTLAPHVTVGAPNGGQNWTGCSTQNITINHGGTSGVFLIEYSTNNGTSWITVAANYNAGAAGPTSNYSWQVPNTGTIQGLVRVTDVADALKTDVSNANFTITQTTNVVLITPNGGENWVAGTTQNITYSVGGGVTQVRLEYSTDNGTTWVNIVNNHTGGVYNWTIPNINTTTALVRATDMSNACNSDQSNTTLNLISQVAVTAPNGGETWQATVGAQGASYNMDNVPITLNTGNFYDPGGIAGNFSCCATYTKTFTPDVPINKLRMAFNNFNLASSSNTLTIYNGPSTAFPTLANVSGNTSPGTVTSTHASGALTVVFSVNTGTVGTGWEAAITSVGTPTRTVTWSKIGTSNTFNLDYSTNAGTSWVRILTNYPTVVGSFDWSVPNTPTTQARFRVMDYNNNAIVDASDANFTIGQAAQLVVTPNGGEVWHAGTTQTITWVSMFNPGATVKLEYSTDNGATWNIITASTPNVGNYAWTVPLAPSTQALIRVTDNSNPTQTDVSNAVFTLNPHVVVVTPNGGQTLTGCQTYNVTWTHGGTTGQFLIEWSTNNGSTWSTIASNVNGGAGPNASYSWTVNNVTTTQGILRVTDMGDPLKTDVSNTATTVNQTTNVVLITPNGGESWVAGTIQNITYSVGGGVTAVRLEYSTDNGTTWTSIVNNHTGGVYAWTIPNVNSTQALVRAVDVSNACNADQSNATLNLISQISVSVPNGGESWQATVGVQGLSYNMDNVPVTLNTGNFYDPGGIAGNFSCCATYTKTFTPDVPTNKLRMAFNNFNLASSSNTLTIYNGPSTAFPTLANVSGNTSPGTVTSTHASGALTVVFSVNTGTVGTGWEAAITSIGTPTRTVTWNKIGTSNTFNLDYSTNAGTSWVRILTNYPTVVGSFDWSVPNTPTTQARFRVMDYNNNAIVDASDANFTIGQAAQLVVTPNGGEVWHAGTTQTITWVSMFNPGATVKIEYSTDNGATWLSVINSTPNVGSYAWTVPLNPSTQALIRVTDNSNPTQTDVSNAVFTLNPHVVVVTPNGGQTLTGCQTYNVTWTHGGTTGQFRIEWSTDNGTSWSTVATNVNGGAGPNGSYSWTVNNVNTSQGILRVSDMGDPLKTDVSNTATTVNQTTNVVLISPNGGENWVAGTTQNITYSIGGGVSAVRLEYSTDNGTTWTVITNNHSAGVYAWTIPNVNSTQALVRAVDVSNACNADQSNATLNLISQISVNVPNGGENWIATVGAQGLSYNMDNVPVTLNTGNFYDPGGIAGNFSCCATYTKTFTPDVPTNKLRMAFNNFNLASSSNTLVIYNGPSTAFPTLANVSGNTSPGTVTSTHASGALTVVFSVNTGTVGTGWEAAITSVGTPTRTVTWNKIGTSNTFNLEYSTNAGTSWTRILTNYPATVGTFDWSVPNTPTTQARFRVMDYGNNAIVDASDANFTIGQAAELLVTPNGGEVWHAGTTQTITWVSMFNPGATVKIEYSTDNGTTWLTIINSTPNVGSYAWTAPLNPSTQALVRVTDNSNPTQTDVSNAVFTLNPHVVVTSPNGGENWTVCGNRTITWTHGGTSGSFKLEYSTDNGTSWTLIANNVNGGAGPNASYNWTVANTGTNQAVIRVTDMADVLKTDVSNTSFIITPTNNVVLFAPNGGESWVAGTTQNITYSLSGGVTSVRLEYSTDNGTTWVSIVNNHSTGVYAWTIPNVNSTQALVRAVDVSNACNSDQSNTTLNLVSQITVLTPNGSEVWQATVGPQGLSYNMDNVPVTLNTGNFYDPGGISGNFTCCATYTKTFTPDVPINKLRMAFNNFNLASSSNTLTIYNGPSTAFPTLANVSGNTSPGTVTSTHSSGALTVVFSVNTGTVGTGWEAVITSVGTPTRTVTWNKIGTSNTFNLEYSTNAGTNWTRILTNYPAVVGTFDWSVPNTPSTQARFRVMDYGNNAIVDVSDANFTIGAAAPLLIAPYGGEFWYAGTTQNITWMSTFMPIANVRLEYSTDNGTTWITIIASTPNTGSYTWTIPNTPSTQALVRVSDPNNAATNDISNTVFTLMPHVTVSTPNGGQTLIGCQSYNITWLHGGTSGQFRIEWSTDGGTSWSTIASNVNGGAGPNGSYSWTVNNVGTTQGIARVTDMSDPLKTDVSNATTTVNQTANTVVVVPNGNENWIAGTVQTINYSVAGGVTAVRLEYSTDNGTTWTTIVNNTSGGAYAWTIPNVHSTQALIRATDVSNSCNSDVSNAVFTLSSTITITLPNGGETWPGTVGPQGSSYNMDNVPVTLNTGNFYDPGGISGNFSCCATYTKTFTPDVPINKLRMAFNNFNLASSSNTLTIYNGPSTAFPTLAVVSGNTSPGTVTSTHASGALTVTFSVNTGTVGTGWEAAITSVNGTTAQPVTWSRVGTSNAFNLDYTTNNGTSWIRILTNYPNLTGTFDWQVPNTISTNARFRVTDYNNNNIVDQSDAVFTIGEPVPLLAVPNGGETWYSGQIQNITWSAPSFLNTLVRLEFSTDNGNTWSLITSNAPNNGSYPWTVPSTLTPLPVCLVRVSDPAFLFKFDVSNNVFQIRPPILITSPNSPTGSTWRACTQSSITWTAGASNSYKIELSTNAGSTWSIVAANYSNASSNVNYTWSIPNTPSTQCLVRVTDNANPSFTDVSDSLFTISPSIKLTYPNFGATIQSGTVLPISWINYNASNFYNIDYSTDGGLTWNNIVTNHNTVTQGYSWTVPALNSNNCLIRVSDFTASCKEDISDYVFTVQPTTPPVTVTSPNGGENLAGCANHTITWTTNGTSTLFNIEYSTNGGASWNIITTNYNTASNNFVWTVPNIATSLALVRVTDATSTTKTDVSNQVFTISQPVTAVISPSGTINICSGSTQTLTSNNATGNVWSTGATTQSITVGASGTYTVTVTNAGCSAASTPVTVTVNPLPATPTISASGPTTFCAGGSVVLTSSSPSGNRWLPGNQTTQSIVASASGNYSVIVTNANGCSSTSNPVAVTVNPLPTAPTAGSNSPVTTGSAINLTASTVAGATYAWTGPNSFTSTSQNPTISGATAAMAGTYSVVATAGGCSSSASTTLVNVVPGGATVTLSGTIKHPNLVSFIPGVTVDLAGPTTSSVVTVANGQYSLTANTGGSYTVTPSKANDVTTNNGVTTLDLVLMQRHILQQDTLDSPYQIIAADVNNSGTVTTLDIVLTRTVILQTNLTFPSGRLWAMVDASYVFPNTYTPFPFPSTRTYASASNASNQDFYGVKLGDVNWSWNPSIAKVSYTGDLGVGFGKTKGRVGELVTIPVRVYDFDKIAGYQYTIEWDGSVLEYVGVEAGAHLPSLGDARASEGILTVSWNDEQGDVVTLADGSVAFNLQFRVVGESGMSAQLKATSSVVNGEAYDEDLNHLAIVSRESGFEVVGDGGAMSAGDGIQVMQNFPNPFSKETTVRFELPETKQLRLTVSDLSGRVVVTQSGLYEAGTHEWKWNGKSDNGGDLPSGTYLLRIQAGETAKTIRMVYTRE